MLWPHAPVHRFTHHGAYMITGSTYLREHHLATAERLDGFVDLLMRHAGEFGMTLQAWAVFSNHYHLIAVAPDRCPQGLSQMIAGLHEQSAKALNRLDSAPGRQVWFQYWDTALTYEKSYLARLQYVHTNAVHHRLAAHAADYRWCSAAWFEATAPAAFVKTVGTFKVDRVKVVDEYEPRLPG